MKKLFLPACLLWCICSQALAQHPEIYNTRSNSIPGMFKAVDSVEQKKLSIKHPLTALHSDNSDNPAKKIRWVTLQPSTIEELRLLAADALSKAVADSDFVLFEDKDDFAQYRSADIKHSINFPINMNFNFYNDVQFDELYFKFVSIYITDEGEIHYSIQLKPRQDGYSSVYIEIKDKVEIRTSIAEFNIWMTQVKGNHYRVFRKKKREVSRHPEYSKYPKRKRNIKN